MSDCARPGVTILAARCEIVIDRKGQLSEPKVHVVVEHIIPNLGRLPLAGKSAGVKSAAAQVDPDVAIPQQPTDALLAVPQCLTGVGEVAHQMRPAASLERKSAGEGKGVYVRVELGGS